MKSRYKPLNYKKYIGNPANIYYRSSWEFAVMRYLDTSSTVELWSSEEFTVKYLCPTDNRLHTYYIDFFVKFSNGTSWLIELKPKNQVEKPKKTKRKREKTYLTEVKTYLKNQAKWSAAHHYAEKQGWKFVIWTEDTLKKLGILVINS